MRTWPARPARGWVRAVPSERSGALVPDFAQRLAEALGLPYADVLERSGRRPAAARDGQLGPAGRQRARRVRRQRARCRRARACSSTTCASAAGRSRWSAASCAATASRRSTRWRSPRRSRRATIPAMTDTPPEPVARLLQAANGHDTDAFLANFTEDGVVDDWGREFAGADAIRGWSDAEFIGVEVTLAVTGVATEGDETTVTAQVGGERLQRAEHLHLRGPRRPRGADDDPRLAYSTCVRLGPPSLTPPLSPPSPPPLHPLPTPPPPPLPSPLPPHRRGIVARNSVPPPGGLSTSSVPSKAATRSPRPRSPLPPAVARRPRRRRRPRPSGVAARPRCRRSPRPPRACLTTLVSASETKK